MRVAVFCRNELRIAMSVYDYSRVDEIIALIEQRFGRDVELLELVGDCACRLGNFETALSAFTQCNRVRRRPHCTYREAHSRAA